MADQASSDISSMASQREIDEQNKYVTEEYRQAFTTHLQWLLSLAGAKQIIKEEVDAFVILLILAVVYGFHLWKMSRSVEPEYNRYITKCIKPNLIGVVFLLIVIDVIGFPFKWVIISSITAITTVASVIQTHPTFLDQMKEILVERWKRVQDAFKWLFNFKSRSNTVGPPDANGESGNQTNPPADEHV